MRQREDCGRRARALGVAEWDVFALYVRASPSDDENVSGRCNRTNQYITKQKYEGGKNYLNIHIFFKKKSSRLYFYVLVVSVVRLYLIHSL